MKIIVCIKQTFDTEAKIALDVSGQVISQGIKEIMNPYDEFAVEEAVRLKESLGAEVTIISLGDDSTVNTIRQALAMGADQAVLLNDSTFQNGDEYTTAKALAKAIGEMEYDLILAGWTAIDDGSAQVASRVAELLDIPQITIVTNLTIENNNAVAHREIEGGQEIIEASLPVMITTQKGLNEPRYPALKQIMKAKKKEIKKVGCLDLGLNPSEFGTEGSLIEIESIFLPPKRQNGKILEGEPQEIVLDLVKSLKEEAKVL